jgi:toxin CptA
MTCEHYRVALAPSRIAAFFVLVAGGATLVLVAMLPLPAGAAACAILWVGATWLGAYRRAVCAGPRSVREVHLHRDRRIEVVDAARRSRAGRLQDGCFVAPWLTIVRWRPDGARLDRTVLILPDMLAAEGFRRLRVTLKWG